MKTLKNLKEDLGAPEKFKTDKNLTWEDAKRKTLNKVKGDFRDIHYDPKTGIVTYT